MEKAEAVEEEAWGAEGSAPEPRRVRTFVDPVAFAVLPWQQGLEEWQSSRWRGATGVEFASQHGASSLRRTEGTTDMSQAKQ